MPPVTYELVASDGRRRAGLLHTPHGTIETPVFMPVGTRASVRAVEPGQLLDQGIGILLANAYHLMLKPGEDIIKEAGGLHRFMNWQGAILTDSGGFQVFSLADLRKISDDGVFFTDPTNGNKHFITPERSMQVQGDLGADIGMAFDECVALPCSYETAKDAVERTTRWAKRCKEAHRPYDHFQALFGIVQGALFPELREQSARELVELDFPGYAVGGLSVGETREEMEAMLQHTVPFLPSDKPRYLMGVGTPEDLVVAVNHGIDMFDCVMPTRIARHGAAFTPDGRIQITNARFRRDHTPLVAGCPCLCCSQYTRSYLHHLFKAQEYLGYTLLSLHNIRHLQGVTRDLRQDIIQRAALRPLA